MAAKTYEGAWSVDGAVRRLCRNCTVLDRSELNLPTGRCVMLELSMRIALPVHATVTVDDFSGKTRVHIAVEPGLFAKRMETRLAAALTAGGGANRKSEGAGA